MKMTLRTLRRIIRETISKPFDIALVDDEANNEKSVYVSNDAKTKIKKWTSDMGLDNC